MYLKAPFSLSLLCLIFTSLLIADGAVWRVEKNGYVLYLGGTIHMLRTQDYPLPNSYDEAFAASSQLVFETDPGALNSPPIQEELRRMLRYGPGESIAEHISPERYRALRQYWDANALPKQLLKRAKPMLLMLVMVENELGKSGSVIEGVDGHYYERARKASKRVRGLVDARTHIALLGMLGKGAEEEFIQSALQEIEILHSEYEKIMEAWRLGDETRLEALLVTPMKTQTPLLYKQVLSDRNRLWMNTLNAYLKTPETEFVLVGTAHLVGEDGLLKLLKEAGCSVTLSDIGDDSTGDEKDRNTH